MGIIAKLEDKLGGHSKEESKLERKAVKQEAHDHNSGSSPLNPTNKDHLQNPISSQSGSGPQVPSKSGASGAGPMSGASALGGAGAMGGAGGMGSHGLGEEGQRLTGDARHSRDGYGGQSSGMDKLAHPSQRPGESEFRDNDGYGSQGMPGSFDNNATRGPREPFDPYSSKGQSVAAAGAAGRRSHDQGGRSSLEDPNVPRSRMGGVRNSLDDPARRENRDAIPTAGGQELGSSGHGGPYDHQQQQHHYGRDAALAGGAGAAGTGLYEHEKGRRHHDDGAFESGRDRRGEDGLGDTGPASKTAGPHKNNLLNKLDPRVDAQAGQQQGYGGSDPYGSESSNRMGGESNLGRSQDQHHYGRDAALAGGAGAGAYELDKRHRRHENEKENPVGSAYSTDEPSQHSHHGRGHHDRDQYESGQSGGYGQQPSNRNYDDISYMNKDRPAQGTQLDQYESGRQGQGNSPRDHHFGRDAALAGGAGAGAGALASRHHHQEGGHHGRDRDQYDEPSSQQGYGQNQRQGGMLSSGSGSSSHKPEGGKLAAAYESGFEAGVRHMEEMMKNQRI